MHNFDMTTIIAHSPIYIFAPISFLHNNEVLAENWPFILLPSIFLWTNATSFGKVYERDEEFSSGIDSNYLLLHCYVIFMPKFIWFREKKYNF